MAGYSRTPLSKKLGIKPGMRVCALNSPFKYEKFFGKFPDGVLERAELERRLDFIHFFTASEVELRENFPRLRLSLDQGGTLWISWPKVASKMATDLNDMKVRRIGLANGLVDVKVCAVDDTWSGLKFVYRLKDRSK